MLERERPRSVGAEGVVFAAADPVPEGADELRDWVWFALWSAPWDTRLVFELGSAVYLATPQLDRVVWESSVREVISVPFESAEAFREMVGRRWGQPLGEVDGLSPAPGWGVAWRADPVRRLDVVCPDAAADAPRWQLTEHLDPAWRRALGLSAADTEWTAGCGCSGESLRPHLYAANERGAGR